MREERGDGVVSVNEPDRDRTASGVLNREEFRPDETGAEADPSIAIRAVFGDINAVPSVELAWKRACRERL